AQLLNENGLTEIEIERDGLKLRIARQAAVASTAAPALVATATAPMRPAPTVASAEPAVNAAAELASHPGCVNSPMVGTAYRSPEPGSPPFIEIGARVTQGQTLLIIE